MDYMLLATNGITFESLHCFSSQRYSEHIKRVGGGGSCISFHYFPSSVWRNDHQHSWKLTGLIRHGWPSEKHGVQSDDRWLEKSRMRLVFLFKTKKQEYWSSTSKCGLQDWIVNNGSLLVKIRSLDRKIFRFCQKLRMVHKAQQQAWSEAQEWLQKFIC